MDTKHENLSNNESNEEFDPKIQALADMAGKMGELVSKPEYNKFGFDHNGVHKNGTRFDEEGYGADGFNQDGYNRAGYNREGLNKKGFNKKGIHYLTHMRYDTGGYDKNGYNRDGFDWRGYDRDGYDTRGYDKSGFDRRGFAITGWSREGINSITNTKFNLRGWNQFGTIHEDTGTKYDLEGYDVDGFDEMGRDRKGYDRKGRDSDGYDRDGFDKSGRDRDGYDRKGFNKEGYDRYGFGGFNKEGYDRYGFDESGYNIKTNTKFDENGYDSRGIDSYGFDRSGGRRHPDGSPMFYTHRKNGYDKWGVDKDGYKEDGFNRFGFDREGYDREGLDKDGYTREYNAKFNKFGVDENGYMKNGEIDPDVEFAISFSESGIKELTKYAAEKGMEYKEVQDRIESARKKFPAIDETITNILLTGNKMRAAAISNDCEKFINGELDVKEFWDKHPRLNISGILFNFINDPEKRKQFSDRTVENLVLDSDSIEENLRIFGTSQYDVPGALKGIEDFKKTYVRFGVDGSPEQIQKKRENTKKIFDTMKYLSKYKNQNLNTLLGSRQSFDGGQTWTDFNGELIGHAMDALKADKKLICVQSVKDYIVKQIKNSSQNKIQ